MEGSTLFIASWGASGGLIGKYDTSGNVLNASLIQGLSDPMALAIEGLDLFVTNGGNGTVGEYTTSGATIDTALLSGLSLPSGIAVSDSDLYVADSNAGTIWDYDLKKGTTNQDFVTGLGEASGIAYRAVPEPGNIPLIILGGMLLSHVIRTRRLIDRGRMPTQCSPSRHSL